LVGKEQEHGAASIVGLFPSIVGLPPTPGSPAFWRRQRKGRIRTPRNPFRDWGRYATGRSAIGPPHDDGTFAPELVRQGRCGPAQQRQVVAEQRRSHERTLPGGMACIQRRFVDRCVAGGQRCGVGAVDGGRDARQGHATVGGNLLGVRKGWLDAMLGRFGDAAASALRHHPK